jgi:hypothetical protein
MQKATARREDESASGEAGGDRLCKLPDDILLNILERVETLDALRTCILCKRMLKLCTMLSRFDINLGSLWRHHKARRDTTLCLVRYNNVVADCHVPEPAVWWPPLGFRREWGIGRRETIKQGRRDRQDSIHFIHDSTRYTTTLL